MAFVWKDNLITQIKTTLDSWIIWTKATNLNSDWSSFEIQTQDTSASVRWTIFWVRYNWASTDITVLKGSVEIKKLSDGSVQTKDKWKHYWTEIKYIPNFNIKTRIPNNTYTWALSNNTEDLLAKYKRKHPKKDPKIKVKTDVKYCTKYGETPSINKNCKCHWSTSLFKMNWKSYCEDTLDWKKLYAFAPYDTAGDLDLYYKDWHPFQIEKWDKILMNCDWFYWWNCSYTSFTIRWCTSYNKNNSFCEYSSWEKWIFLNKNPWNDFIKYSNLNLSWDYIIKMNVRLSRDKKSWWPYYLLNSKNENLNLYIQNRRVNKIWKKINNKYFDDNFHTFTLYNNWNLKIDWDSLWTISINPFSNLYVWANYFNNPFPSSHIEYIKQWNDIINYIKIYKN